MVEGKRVLFSRKRLLLLVVLIVVCALHISNLQNLEFQRQMRQVQEQRLAEYQNMPLAQVKEDLFLKTEGGSMVTLEYSAILRQVEYQLEFPDYLAQIQKRAQNMSTVSIFGGSPESRANIKKTALDYARLENLSLTLGHDTPVTTVLFHSLSNYLICIYMLIVVYAFLAERKRGLWNMVSASPRGRMRMAAWRLGTLAIAAVMIGVAMTATEIICAYSIHGGWDELGRIAQSVKGLESWTYPMTMAQLWMVYALLRCGCAFIVGMLAWFLMELVADRRLVPLTWAAAVAVEYGLSRLPERSLLRQINLFTYLNPKRFLLEYRNIPLFHHPFGQLELIMGLSAILCVLMLAGIFVVYRLRKPVDSYGWLDRVLNALRRVFAPLGCQCSLLAHELYKNLVTGRGWMILVGAIAAAALLAEPSVRMDDSGRVSMTLESYFRQSQGPIGDETDAYLARRQERIDTMLAQREDLYQKYSAGEISEDEFKGGMMTLENLDEQVLALDQYRQYVTELKQTSGSYVVPHWVHGMLLGAIGGQTRMTIIIMVVAVILLFFALAGAERRTGMLRSRRAMPRGRRECMLQRHCAAWLVTILYSAVTWTAYLLQLKADYGELPWLEAPVRCLLYFSNMTGNLSILGYYLLLVAVRTLGLCLLASVVLVITEMGAIHGNKN